MGTLRLILAIAVVIFHSSSIFGIESVGGQIAVQAFYIISGFYMALILNEKYIGLNNSYKLFITNRFLRLYPIYWTVLIITILSSTVSLLLTNGENSGALYSYLKYYDSLSLGSFIFIIVTNIIIFFQDVVLFLGIDTTSGHLFFTSNFGNTNPPLYSFYFVPQAWTIGVELTFYLIAPFIARRRLKIIFLLIFLSLLLRLILIQNGLKYDPWSYRFFPTEMVFFLLGIVSYKIYNKMRAAKINKLFLNIIFIVILSFTLLYNFITIPGKYFLFFLLFFLCLPFIFILTKKWKFDTYIGEWSYPIYISHLLLLRILHILKIPDIGGLGLSLTIVSILFSIVLNELLTKRIERIRQKRVRPIVT